jgi:N-acyl-D-aspartate/D-glutamate deacylase
LKKNGKIIDGSGSPWFIGDIAIENGKIIAIGKLDENKGKEITDGRGRSCIENKCSLQINPHVVEYHLR